MQDAVALREKQVGDILIVSIKGRLDAISSVEAEKQIFSFIDEGHIKLILNFKELDYLSSVGMRLLLRATKRLKALSGKLVVCQVSVGVMDILKMSGFDHVIEFARTEEEALKKFS